MELIHQPSYLADQIGLLKAQKAALTEQITGLEKQLAGHYGPGSYEGSIFRATVSVFERRTTDWKAIASKFEVSRQLLAAHSTYSDVTQVRVVSRQGLKVAA